MFCSLKQKGFSLVEAVVVISVLFIVTGFLGYFVVNHFWIYNNQTAELEMANGVRTALDSIDNYVRQAYRIENSYSGYYTGEKAVILKIPSINGLNQVVSGKHDNIVFYLSGDVLVRQIFADESSSRQSVSQTLADGIDADSFLFSYDNPDYPLARQVTTSITILNQSRSITVSSKSSLRN